MHHRQGQHYVKVYWPYLPLLAIIGMGLLFSNVSPRNKHGVLAYATNVSVRGLLDATNEERVKNHLGTLALNAQLSAAAQAKANDMATRDYWSHNTPEGKEPWVFIQQNGYKYQKAGENLAYGFDTSDNTVTGWMNSPSHRANVLDSDYLDVGFGFANAFDYQGVGKETIVVAMYGKSMPKHAIALTKPTNSPTAQLSHNTKNHPISTANPIAEPATLAVNRIQTITGGRLPWVSFAVGLLSGGALIYLITKHGLALRKLALEGESFILHHPLVDVALVGLIVILSFFTTTNGFIR